jgi:hypothetical protein
MFEVAAVWLRWSLKKGSGAGDEPYGEMNNDNLFIHALVMTLLEICMQLRSTRELCRYENLAFSRKRDWIYHRSSAPHFPSSFSRCCSSFSRASYSSEDNRIIGRDLDHTGRRTSSLALAAS